MSTEMHITLFKSPTCPNCKMLQMKLDKKGVTYDVVTDVEVMKAKGISALPQLDVNGERLGFADALRWLNSAPQAADAVSACEECHT